MSRTLSMAGVTSILAETTSEVWLALLTLSHPSLATPLRFVQNTESLVSRGNTFVATGFELELPGEDEDAPGEGRLSIDNVDRQIVIALRALEGPLTVMIEVIRSSALDTVELSIPEMKMRDVDWDALKVSGILRFEDISLEPLTLQMTPQRLPGLFSVFWCMLAGMAALASGGGLWS